MYSENAQYFLDLLVLILTFVLWFPLFVIIFIIIFLNKKIFYVQERYGKNFRKFKMIKFLTILPNQNVNDISNFNRFLRRSSFDEIPQILM